MGTKASSYFPLTSVSTMACWHKKAVADSRWDWTTLPRCSQPAAPDRANQGGTSHLEIHLETELTDHSWTRSPCVQILHKCSPSEQALHHPLAGTLFHPLGLSNQHCQLLHHFHQSPAILQLWPLFSSWNQIWYHLCSHDHCLWLHLELLPRLFSCIDNAIFPSEKTQTTTLHRSVSLSVPLH